MAYLLFDWVAPYGGTSRCQVSRGRQAVNTIEPPVGFRLVSGGLFRGDADLLRLIAAVW